MRALWLLLLAGCSATEVDMTLLIDPAIPLDQVVTIGFAAEGDGDFYNTGIAVMLHDRTQRLIYRARHSSGQVTFDVSLFPAGGTPLGCGRAMVDLADGKAVPVEIDIAPGACAGGMPGDMGVSDGGMDLAGADLSGADLAGVDLAGPTPIFFDDFESGNTSKWSPFNANGGFETIVPGHAGNGVQFEMLAPDGGFMGYPQAQLFYSTGARDLWIRAWYLGNSQLYGMQGSQLFVRVYDGSNKGVTLGYQSFGTIDESDGVNSQVASATWGTSWLCVEWHVDTANGVADIYLADHAQPDAHLTFAPFQPTYFNFGLESYLNEHLIVDDVYVAASRVGCSTPTP